MNQTINVNNLIEIRRIGLQALKEALGPVGMVRFIRKVWFNTPELAPAQTRQRFQKFGIKPDGIINFLFERASVPNQASLKIPRSLLRGGSFNNMKMAMAIIQRKNINSRI